MTALMLIVLTIVTLLFSAYERRLWGSGKTPFAFIVYPFLAMLILAVFAAPRIGFLEVHLETLLVCGLFFALVALASIACRALTGNQAGAMPRLERWGHLVEGGARERTVGTTEYVMLGAILLAAFVSTMLHSDAQVVTKGQLGAGGAGGHLIEIGMAYMVIAVSQRRGQRVVRSVFVLLVLWLLAINQVKYLILLPLAAGVLYRWVSRQLSTWTLAVITLIVPLVIVIIVYAFFGMSAAASGTNLTPTLVLTLATHMASYLVSGIIGLDRLLIETQTVAFGTEGLSYTFAPFINLLRFVVGSGDYFDVVNPLYLVVHTDGELDSNVFTFFGSLLFRGGWICAIGVSIAFAMMSYWIWSRWRMREGSLECAAGSWWLSTLLFTWHDPFFIHLAVIEVMAVLWLRGRFRLQLRSRTSLRHAAVTDGATN